MPALPPSETEILPSLDDEPEDAIDNNDEDDIDDEEDMMADEADADEEEDDYDSDEEDDGRVPNDEPNWDSLSTPQDKVPAKESTSTAAPATTQKPTELPTPGSSSSAVIDPYFTHFDPREEHQSYKVKVRNTLFMNLS